MAGVVERLSRAIVACVLALGVASAVAEGTDPPRARQKLAELQKRFAEADANGDGRLTKDEAHAKMPMVYTHFDEIDAAHSGSVSLAEIVGYARDHRGERQR